MEGWYPEENKVIFAQKDPKVEGIFTKGKKIDMEDPSAPILRVQKVLEEPEAVQMPPYLRPKVVVAWEHV